ncbi:MAG TPA: hypothetical protein VGD64_04755 [Acidisarcina sp.]
MNVLRALQIGDNKPDEQNWWALNPKSAQQEHYAASSVPTPESQDAQPLIQDSRESTASNSEDAVFFDVV